MPNFQVLDAYGSVITIESSTVGSANRQVVAATTGNSSVTLLGGTNVLGSIAALQGTSPWNIAGSVATTLQVGTAVIGSVATLQGTNPWIMSGSMMALNSAAIIGSVTTLQGTNPWNVAGSVLAVQGVWSGSILAIQGTWSGSTLATISGTPNVNTAGSVVAYQGTNPWVIGSVLANVGGSVLSQQLGTRISSVVNSIPSSLLTGVHGHRNDAIASYLGGNLTWNPIATDSAGRIITKPFSPEQSRIEGYASTVNVSVTTLVAAAGAGLRNYITDVWLANTGAATTLVTFRSGGGTSVLGYTIAPTASGSNLPGLVTPMRTLANETFDFQASTGTSVLYATVKGFIAP